VGGKKNQKKKDSGGSHLTLKEKRRDTKGYIDQDNKEECTYEKNVKTPTLQERRES